MATTLSREQLSKIGIGSYGIGGRGHRGTEITEKEADEVYINAVAYTLNKGSNFTEISMGYGHGKSLELFKQGLDRSSVTREDVFITHSFYPRDVSSIVDMQNDMESFLQVLKTDYADSVLVTQPLILQFGEVEVFAFLHSLLDSKKTRYVSLSNAGVAMIKRFKQEFSDLFFAHEGHLSFEVRTLQDKGIFELCNNLNVESIIWRPLRRSATLSHNWPLLKELAEKYDKSFSQIILNWMTRLSYRPMVFSTNTNHIDENLESLTFKMSETDYARLTNFRPVVDSLPSIDWDGVGIDDDIVGLVRDIDQLIA